MTTRPQIGRYMIDNFTPNALMYTRAGNSAYYYYEQKIEHGTHTITPIIQNATYTATVVGYGNGLGYGFMAALELPCVAVNRHRKN